LSRNKTEAAESKVKSAVALGSLGGAIAGPIGGTIGALTGLLIGDSKTVFPIDMIAIPAFEYAAIRGGQDASPSYMVYIKAGETLVPTGGNVADMSENMDINATSQTQAPKKRTRKTTWHKYMKNKKNQIRFKSGKMKGRLNLKSMARAYKKSNKGGKK